MGKGPQIAHQDGLTHSFVRGWLSLQRRKIRFLHAAGPSSEGAALFAVSHPASFMSAVVLSTATDRPVRCLLSKDLVRGPIARFLAGRLGMILYEGEESSSEAVLREAVDVLAGGGTLVVFADQSSAGQGSSGASAATAASLLARVEAQLAGTVAVYPVHLFLPEPNTPSREILVYMDTALTRPQDKSATLAPGARDPVLIAELESRFKENAFQLRPADLQFFLTDLEEILRTGLQEDWATRPEWKQDTEGFVLSRFVADWIKETNYLNPGRLVALRNSLDDYRRLQKQCAMRELVVEGGDSLLGSGWRRLILWLETVLGFPIALYGFLNHLAIALVLFLAGSFKRDKTRALTTEWAIRIGVALGFYVLQIFLVAHRWGRAAAGYYAPTLPVSGLYLWRYAGLIQPQARLLFISLTIPRLKEKINRLRHTLLEELDQTLGSSQ